MKRIDLIKTIEAFGCTLVRHGGKHDWYHNPASGISQPVPRHREINERLARRIIRLLGNAGRTGPDNQSFQSDKS
jgi:predicted RNA binding protein YcfA (HicA-like mRNA interferase family)